MPRDVSQTLREAVHGQETGEAFLVLLTLNHDDLAAPIRVVNDGADLASRGETFQAFPFRLALPSDMDERPPRMRLQIDNVDRTVVQALRSISGAPTVLVEVVLASDPDTVEASFPDFVLRAADYDALAVTGELVLERFIHEPFPAQRFTPANFPGLF